MIVIILASGARDLGHGPFGWILRGTRAVATQRGWYTLGKGLCNEMLHIRDEMAEGRHLLTDCCQWSKGAT